MSGHLELRIGPGGLRHFLDGEPVHTGDKLELEMPPASGTWELGRYEAKHRTSDIFAALIVARLGVTVILNDTTMVLRWPGPRPVAHDADEE